MTSNICRFYLHHQIVNNRRFNISHKMTSFQIGEFTHKLKKKKKQTKQNNNNNKNNFQVLYARADIFLMTDCNGHRLLNIGALKRRQKMHRAPTKIVQDEQKDKQRTYNNNYEP